VSLFAILLIGAKLEAGISGAYIPWVQKVLEMDLPVTVVLAKSKVEYGKAWGGKVEDFYLSVDCSDTTHGKEIYVELGGNCLMVGGFYNRKFRMFDIEGSLGFLRIDVAGLASGKFGEREIGEIVDEERNGVFIGLEGRFSPISILLVTPFINFGTIKAGSFKEGGINLGLRVFRNREDFLKYLSFTFEASLMNLGVTTEKAGYQPLYFGYYLVGINYLIGEEEEEEFPRRRRRR
jgi:hypothetical protein